MDKETLLDQLTQDVLTYVMHGEFPEHHFAQELAPSELDERFHDYEMLVRLHFILRPDVVEFVERLPKELRKIKTQTSSVSTVNRGVVDGRINWSATTRRRYSRNPNDRSLFVCDNRTEDYDIDENVVLKRLLAIIYETLSECEEYLARDYQWVNERWKGETDLVATMRDVFHGNVHVTRIRRPAEYEPTDRMLQRASESRQHVYREAAGLLSKYRATLSGEEDAIAELLETTAITPDDEETLFELFVLFRYIGVVEGLVSDRFTLNTIEAGSQAVARLDSDDQSIVVYHDSSAKAEELSFRSNVREKEFETLSRTEKVKVESRRLTDQYLGRSESPTRSRRPDVIVLEVETDERLEYLITEVKYSSRKETVERGVEELLGYLAFLRDDEELVFEEPEIFGGGWNGVLVVQDIEDQQTKPVEDQSLVRIMQASELESKLEDVVTNVLG